MSGAREHRVEITTLKQVPLKITSYRIADTYYCQVASVDPGATIARAQGSSYEESRSIALEKAGTRL